MFRLRTLIMMAAVLLAAGATSAEAAFKVRIPDLSSIGGTINNAAGRVDVAAQTVDLGNGEFTQPGAGTLTLFNAPPPFVGPGHFGNTKTGNFAYAGGNFSISEEVDMSLGVGTLISF